jgi:glutamate formiminotransferase/formiminotetrahydrofolate cyclodeaminase
VDEDTDAFNKILEAYGLPKKSEEEKALRTTAIQSATKIATLIPFSVMETAFSGFGLIREMVEKGNPNSITDAGVGALALRSSILGACLNVIINSMALDDREFAADIINKAKNIELMAIAEEESILQLVNDRISK